MLLEPLPNSGVDRRKTYGEVIKYLDAYMLNLKASIDALICSIEEQENRRAEIVGKVSRMNTHEADKTRILCEILQKTMALESNKHAYLQSKLDACQQHPASEIADQEYQPDQIIIDMSIEQKTQEIRSSINKSNYELLALENKHDQQLQRKVSAEPQAVETRGTSTLNAAWTKLMGHLIAPRSGIGSEIEFNCRKPGTLEFNNVNYFINLFYASAESSSSPSRLPSPSPFIYKLASTGGKYPQLTLDQMYTSLENVIFDSIYHRSITLVGDSPTDDLYASKCVQYASVTQYQMFISDEYASDDIIPWYEAIASLRSLAYRTTPTCKLMELLYAAHAVYKAVDRKLGPGASLKVGADPFMDIWVYVVLKSNVSRLSSNIAFIEEFVSPDRLQSEVGYYLTSLKLAMSFILQMTPEQLKPLPRDVTKLTYFTPQRKKYIERESGLSIVNEDAVLNGYRLFAVEQWLSNSRYYCTLLIPCYDVCMVSSSSTDSARAGRAYDRAMGYVPGDMYIPSVVYCQNHSVKGTVLTHSKTMTESQKCFISDLFYKDRRVGITSVETSSGYVLTLAGSYCIDTVTGATGDADAPGDRPADRRADEVEAEFFNNLENILDRHFKVARTSRAAKCVQDQCCFQLNLKSSTSSSPSSTNLAALANGSDDSIRFLFSESPVQESSSSSVLTFQNDKILTLIPIPDGDYDGHEAELIYMNTLKRLGCWRGPLCLTGARCPWSASDGPRSAADDPRSATDGTLPPGHHDNYATAEARFIELYPNVDDDDEYVSIHLSRENPRIIARQLSKPMISGLGGGDGGVRKLISKLSSLVFGSSSYTICRVEDVVCLVIELQISLKLIGHFPPLATIDGVYGDVLRSSMISFQNWYNKKYGAQKSVRFEPSPGDSQPLSVRLQTSGDADPTSVRCLRDVISRSLGMLQSLGYVLDNSTDTVKEAVVSMQKKHGIIPNGVLNDACMDVLELEFIEKTKGNKRTILGSKK